MNYSNSQSPHVASPQISFDYDEISLRAYQLWQREGQPVGRDQEIWLAAEQELREEHRVPNAPPMPQDENIPDKQSRGQNSSGKRNGKPLNRPAQEPIRKDHFHTSSR